MKKISQIGQEINKISKTYQIGNIQEIRKELKNLKRRPGSEIFGPKGFDDKEGWYLSWGGRSELQFNIGYEEDCFRYGVAYSLETSRSMSDISVLFPSIYKFNSLVRQHPEYFSNYKMWHFDDGRSLTYDIKEIPDYLIKEDVFIFIGKLIPIEDVENKGFYQRVLKTFDDLLEIYKIIEDCNNNNEISQEEIDFIFSNNKGKLPESKNITVISANTDVLIRHSIFQEILLKELITQYGGECVGSERPIGNSFVDIVVKAKGETHFYEVKMAANVQFCIREALGQLLEYGYKGGKKHADKLIIAGEFPIEQKSEMFIKYLQANFSIPISYYQIKIPKVKKAGR
jgi:hypothetical protein